MKRRTELLTTLDYRRISMLLEDEIGWDAALAALEEKLSRASVVEPAEAPADLVTMNSKVVGCGADGQPSEDRRTMTLVYPREANIGEGRISVYAPLGVELLGARAGQTVAWKGVDGAVRRIVIEKILYQPEANGDWHL
jgi:regulator of nucleoside diphosphate kinase